jgi:hypothetical protein
LSNENIIEEIFVNSISSNNSGFYESIAEDAKHEKLDSILPIKFLNSLTPNGLPPHKLNLKIGTCIILLRN